MTDAQTEARAIAERLIVFMRNYGSTDLRAMEYFASEIASALAAKDAELARVERELVKYRGAHEMSPAVLLNERLRAEAQLAEAKKALEELREDKRSAWGEWERAQQEKERAGE